MQSDIEHTAGGWLAATKKGMDLPGLGARARIALSGAFAAYWRAHVTIFAAVVIGICIALAASRLYGFPINFAIYDTLSMFAWVLALVIFIAAGALQLAIHRPARPIRFLWHKLARDWQVHKRLVYALPTILMMTLFMSAFSSMKSAISVIQPYYFDPVAAHIDRVLFLGHDAWQVLQPLIGYPFVTLAINFAYNFWLIMVCTSVLVAAMMLGNDRLRAQYLVGFVLCWVLIGSFLATVFSSVGPCFYSAFYGTDPYAGLMAYLHGVDQGHELWALSTQDMLLETYRASTTGFGSGISAMPSMHLAMTMLTVLFCFRLSRKAGYASVVFLIVIYLGSIHLGWHYASDGLVSIALVPGIWWIAGKIAELPYRGRASASAGAPALQ